MPEETPDPMLALADVAASQFIATMSTDAWALVRESVVRRLNRERTARTPSVSELAAALNSRAMPSTETVREMIRQTSTNGVSDSLETLLARISERQNNVATAVPEDVSPELLDTLTDSAASFADAQPSGMSWETKRTLFLWFWGILVFSALMQAQVQSDPVKELIEDASGAMLIVGPTVAVAAYAWNKTHPNPDREDDEGSTA